MTTPKDESRLAFEKWFAQGFNIGELPVREGDYYSDPPATYSWWAWQVNLQ
jgi:hypothetical protein